MADDKKLESMVQGMIDANETPENIDAAIHLYKEEQNPTLSELKGVMQGLLPGAWGAIRGALYDAPKGAIDDVLAIINGETPENAKAFVEGFAKAPTEFLDASHKERGQMIGRLLGSAGVAKYAPTAPKPIARAVGNIAEQVGTKGAWPIRMMGAHQLGSGNPMGIPIMAIPDVLKKGGQSLKKFGAAETDEQALQKFYGGPKRPEPAPKGVTVMENTPDMWDRAKAAEIASAPKGGPISAIDLARLKKQGYSPEVISQIEKAAGKPITAPSSFPLQQPQGATVPPIKVAPEPMGGPTGQELEANRLSAAERSMPIRASRSRGAGGKLSPNDAVRLQRIISENPDIGLEEAAQLLESERASASNAIRMEKGLNKSAQTALDLDIK